MAICPKCKSNVNTGVQTCPKCGTNMPMGGSGGDLIGGGSLLGGGALQRKQRSGSGGALGVGPTSFGDQVISCVLGCGIFISIRHSRQDATTDRPGW